MKILILTKNEYVDFISNVTLDFIVEHDIEIGIEDFKPFDGEYIWEENEGYDVGISFMYTYKVPKEEIENHIWINFHPGPLPEYKGRNLCYHAIINKEKKFGATAHYMDEDYDTGDIIWVQEFPILEWYNAEDLSNKTIDIAKKMFVDLFPHIVAGKEFPRTKNIGGYYYPKKEIDEFLYISESDEDKIRAITYKDFCPKINVNGVIYKVVKE